MSSGTVDMVTGKVKEIAGQASGDKRLETEGKADQVKGKVKSATADAADAAKGAQDSAKRG